LCGHATFAYCYVDPDFLEGAYSILAWRLYAFLAKHDFLGKEIFLTQDSAIFLGARILL
jgi:hypothetical protein